MKIDLILLIYIFRAHFQCGPILPSVFLTISGPYSQIVPFMTNQVKIVVDPSVSKSWVQIDAIRLIGSTIPKGKQNITAGGPVGPRGHM